VLYDVWAVRRGCIVFVGVVVKSGEGQASDDA